MLTVVAIALIAILVAIALVHVYWAFGGRYARVAAIPEVRGGPAFDPGPLSTLLVALALLACAALVGAAAGFIKTTVDPVVLQRMCYAVSALFLLRAIGDFRLVGYFKTVRGSRFAWLDSVLYSPLCLLMAIGLFLVGWTAA